MNTDDPLPTRASLLNRLKDAGDADETEGGPVANPANLADSRQDFDTIGEAEWRQHLLAQALARVKRQIKPEYYAIYHLHVIENREIGEVTKMLGVNRASIYLAKHRAAAAVKKEIERLERFGG